MLNIFLIILLNFSLSSTSLSLSRSPLDLLLLSYLSIFLSHFLFPPSLSSLYSLPQRLSISPCHVANITIFLSHTPLILFFSSATCRQSRPPPQPHYRSRPCSPLATPQILTFFYYYYFGCYEFLLGGCELILMGCGS